jgi:hypothetical protein
MPELTWAEKELYLAGRSTPATGMPTAADFSSDGGGHPWSLNAKCHAPVVFLSPKSIENHPRRHPEFLTTPALSVLLGSVV